MLILILGILLIISGSGQSDQVGDISERYAFLLHNKKPGNEQEKVKYQYVGTKKCASVCHNNAEMGFQYDIMKSGPHSEAYRILATEKAACYAEKAKVRENPQEIFVCLRCHITGAGLDSSFFAATFKKDEGVTCEACHKGAYISKAFLPKESDCLHCHNDSLHEVRKFNFSESCAKIVHPRPKAKL